MTSRSKLLKAALVCFDKQEPVLAVRGDKTPYRAGWAEYFTRQQTEEEVREQFSNGAWGMAKVLYPACDYVHLDFDGEHAEQAWLKTGIVLPETARQRTPSGGFHLIFKGSNFLKSTTTLKRAVRIVEADCECKKSCGVDFLLNGYAIIPPSPGYREEVPLEKAAKIPDEVVELATAKRVKNPKFTGKIPQGKRDVTLLSIGGVYRRQGMEYRELVKKLCQENEARCEPPLEKEAIEKIARSLTKYEPAEGNEPTKEDKLSFVTIDTVQRQTVEWLWLNRLPIGRLTLLGGDPEAGKSFLSLKIAATITRGEALPEDKKLRTPSFVVLLSTEDDYGDTVRPRLELMQADLSKIVIPSPEKGVPPHLMNAFIEKVAKEVGPALVVIDPIVAFAGKTDTSKAGEVREKLLSPLMLLAGRYSFGCLLNGHLNKQSATRAMYRNSGTVDFVAACRSVFLVAEDPEQQGRRILAHVKSSLALKQPSLSFYIDENGFRWGDETVDVTADELLEPRVSRNREKRQQETAKAFLTKVLEGGAMPTEKIKKRAAAAGITWRTIWRAKDEMGIKARKEQFGPWWWQLADEDSPKDAI